MKITLTKIDLGEATSQNQVIHLFWKKDGEADTAYRALPDATTDVNGNIISPTPYQFTTEGTVNVPIWVLAVNACDGTKRVTHKFDGLALCCPGGYTLSPDGLQCSQTIIQTPTVTQAGVCVACSRLSPEYGQATRFWSGFNYAPDLSDNNYQLLNTPYWSGNPAGSGSTAACGDTSPVSGFPISPVNRQGVWVDTNCDGTKNALTAGAQLQFTWVINSPTPKVVYVGLAGDNNFVLTLNGTQIAARTNNSDPTNFYFLWLFPIQLISGTNYIGASFTGDGSVSDMGCMIIIDNDPSTIPGITDDSQIQYLFQTSQMIGSQPIDIATCNPGFTLDTSGGSGNYRCVQVNTVPSSPC
jgi:hypothetical protein